jgi:flagellum-specific ATP synthase
MPSPNHQPDLSKYQWIVSRTDPVRFNGAVVQVVGVIVESIGPAAHIGMVCDIHTQRAARPIKAEVVGFRDNRVLLMPLGEMGNISYGNEVAVAENALMVPVGRSLLGRVVDGLGQPLDGGGPIFGDVQYPVNQAPPDPLQRKRITEPLSLGVKAIDAALTIGRGQRVGIFSGSGVGKSTLLGMMARNSDADVNVIALIGERGREVREFIEKDLGEEGMRRSVVVVATSEQPAILRAKGALVAAAIAEYFRDQGLDVLLTMDSVTRFAWAQREIGLAVGEPPTTRGYTPSVFAILPKLLERSGTSTSGSITGLYTILVEGDDMNEPVADTVRGILDGHIVLTRELAERNHFPAIDVLQSVSRLMPDITDGRHRASAGRLRELLSIYRGAEDLINIGAYNSGTNPRIDEAVAHIDAIRGFLKQPIDGRFTWEQTIADLHALFGERT